MTRYVGVRLLQAIVVIFIVVLIVFFLLHRIPGGPARGILGQQATQQQIDDFNHAQGFDLPLPVQFGRYLGQMVTGDFGDSYVENQRVGDLVADRLPKTLVLTGLATLLALLVAVPLGVFQAVRRGRASDHVLSMVNFVLYSTPVFFLGFVLIIVFAQRIPLFSAQAPQGGTLVEILSDPRGLALPVITAAAGMIAVFSRYLRSSVIDNLHEDFVRTARAKGASEPYLLRKHVLRNSLTAIVSMIGYYIPVAFGGALVVEQMFNYPGMGLLFWNAAQRSDFPVLLGVVFVIAVATVLGSLLADIAQRLIDPRTRKVTP
ncbi:ABC transporter permease [Pseudonocardia sp. TRM90224]|uniref:ABC transporter permease n=1 Tax=Pseudonocardia sp. TRM90224 TaxID=2812678 RepID=UPI001E2E3EB2|nr:ABC transporter permease [Pseudonocardia sp. TRM90224]